MLLPKVDRAIRRFGLIRPGERVLVAVSGGPDSVALTQALVELTKEHGFDLRLAHLNHQLRKGADADEAFCVQWAERLGLPLATQRIDIAREARVTKSSIEEQARKSRYHFLGKTAARWDCRRVAVGHTRDDQAETFLLRLLRGAGVTGLVAMRPVTSPVTLSGPLPNGLVRPMLDVTRKEVVAFLESRQLTYCQDPSNEDRSIPRNLVRHETLPFLADRHNPNLVATLARTTELLREDEEWMGQEAARALEDLMSQSGYDRDRLWLPVDELIALHPALRRRVVRGAIHLVRGNLRSVTARHVEDVLKLAATGRSGRRLCLPGLACGRSFDRLWFEQDVGQDRWGSSGPPAGRSTPEGSRRYNGYEYALAVPGELVIPEAGGAIRVEETEAASLPEATGPTVKVALRKVDGGLRVRSPVAGDRFRPLGAPGSKSVSRYLMERRVDRERRALVPLVVRSDEEILWVAGYAISEASRIREDACRVLRLSWLA